jgi:hypothetical protein
MSRHTSSMADVDLPLAPKMFESRCERLKGQGLGRKSLEGGNLNAPAASGVGADGLAGIRLRFALFGGGSNGVVVLDWALATRVGWAVGGVKKCEVRRARGGVRCLQDPKAPPALAG